MAIKGGLLRLVKIGCYLVAFCCASVITGAFAWFCVDRDEFEDRNLASLVIGAVTMFYTLVAALFTCCTAGISFFAVISIFLDIVFAALMIAVAAINSSATNGCDRRPYPRIIYRGSRLMDCELFVAAFAVAIVAIFMFIVTAVTQVLIRGHSRKTHVSKGKSGGRLDMA
ncbi:unnamed protein product [Zymoseptoria tritici ST99CH_3D1]|nr:unnamed protein product [Zymoseptoria tritici ST99CH_3D1]